MKAAARSRPDPSLDRNFPHLKALVIARTGHFYYADKDDLLFERVLRRLHATGTKDCAAYIERLNLPGIGDTEWKRLEAEITIGETFFFRYAEQFSALRETILPGILERNRETRRVRIWSAGCATGAEPYSLAILLSELLGEARDDWRISIVGTDINETFLAAAREAVFGQWALRAIPADNLDRYFTPSDERGRWHLRREFRSLVRFERHNLMTLVDGTSPLQFTDFDLVLCRNVLIYFHPDTVLDLVAALRDRLVEGGWLLIGHAEPNPTFATLLDSVHLPGTAAYRRPLDGAEPAQEFWSPERDPETTPTFPDFPKPAESFPAASPTPARRKKVEPSVTAKLPDTADRTSPLDEVRAKANGGEIEEAYRICSDALEHHPLDPALHFFQGLLARQLDLHHDAEKAFRRGIYLDKNFVMAHYHLGLLLLDSGRRALAKRAMHNAARLVAALPPDHQLAEGDGVTAADMTQLVRLHLEPLPALEHGR